MEVLVEKVLGNETERHDTQGLNVILTYITYLEDLSG